MRIWLAATLLAGLGLVTHGCSGETGPKRVKVAGIVERRAEPLVNGTITFLPTAGHNGPAANGTITNGKFEIPAADGPTPGPHQVLINLLPGKMSAEFAAGQPGRKASNRTRWELKADVADEKSDFEFILEED